ncbi:MAG: Ada metal-binding domain-containing protein [Patescibacteria group bacterium]
MGVKKLYKITGKNGEIIVSRKKGRYAGWNGGRLGRRIFGRLDCASGMRMKKERRVFFHTWDDAITAGYRPCRNCKPTPHDTYPKRTS